MRIPPPIDIRLMHDPRIVITDLILVIVATRRRDLVGVEQSGAVEFGIDARDDGVALGVGARGEGPGRRVEDVVRAGHGEGLAAHD